jgi:hypothetical protein
MVLAFAPQPPNAGGPFIFFAPLARPPFFYVYFNICITNEENHFGDICPPKYLAKMI